MAPPPAQNTEKLAACVVDPDSHTRHRLREATRPVYYFGEVAQYSRLDEALSSIEVGRKCDVAFLAATFSGPDVADFVRRAKGLVAGQDTAFVLLVRADKKDKSSIAQGVLDGVDGFLFEPYSVEALAEIARLATTVRRERSVGREKVAMTLLISDVIRQLDLVAYLRSCEMEPERSMRRLGELCGQFKSLSGERAEVFLETMIKLFSELPPPSKSFQASLYKGASLRVKKKMADKLTAEVESQIKSAPSSSSGSDQK